MQTEDVIHFFRKTSLRPVAWERITIPKPGITRWLPRPLKLADLNGDGRPDLVGNCEEYYELAGMRTVLGVAWFENRLNEKGK